MFRSVYYTLGLECMNGGAYLEVDCERNELPDVVGSRLDAVR